MTAPTPGVRVGHLTPAELKVARPSPSWIPAGVILALGLMSLMGTTCVGLGGSQVWRGRVTCSPGAVQVTPIEPEVGYWSRNCRRTGSGGGSRESRRTGSGAVSHDSRRSGIGSCHVNPTTRN